MLHISSPTDLQKFIMGRIKFLPSDYISRNCHESPHYIIIAWAATLTTISQHPRLEIPGLCRVYGFARNQSSLVFTSVCQVKPQVFNIKVPVVWFLVASIGHCAGKNGNAGATELTLKVLLLVSRNWKKRKAKRRKKDRKLRKNGEKERGSVKGNEKGENGNEKGKENVNEKRRRNGSGNENGIGIVTGQKREIEIGIESEIGTEIGKGAQIGIRIGVDQEKRVEIVKGNESGKEKERENGNEKENENVKENEKGNENARERKTRNEIEKRMRKMLMNEENLKENSEKKKLLIKSVLKIGKSENGRRPENMRKRLKGKKKEEEKWQKKLND